MIHYDIWFNFRDGLVETDSLGVIFRFLEQLRSEGSIADFQLLRNSGAPPKSKMLNYQALIEFRDEAQFSAAFSAQAARGIHTGLHGLVMDMVSDFQIEILKEIDGPGENPSELIAELDRRMEEYRKDPTQVTDWEAIKARISGSV